ncbi:esterase/lipase family protein [Granulicella aggregans]|uniref:esterase/lipase family protein n=1 Tax=Granulicella aggregans TaxID=474949 RepID=UPI0021E04244|nr:hypothetical protein [Granulicella aggregans]
MSELTRVLSRRVSGTKLVSLPAAPDLVESEEEQNALVASVQRAAKIPIIIKALAECDASPTRSTEELLGYAVRLLLLARNLNCDILPCGRRTNLLISLFVAAGQRGRLIKDNSDIEIFESSSGFPFLVPEIISVPGSRNLRIVLAEQDFDAELLKEATSDGLAASFTDNETTSSHPESNWLARLPEPGTNNLWYHKGHGNTVLVMVHGVLSDSRGCWLATDSDDKPIAYWPELIAQDRRLAALSVYLGGYYTELESNDYEIRNCAEELYSALVRPQADGSPAPLKYENIIFLGHSTGGIVARYLIESHKTELKNKNVGLILIASPSYGSRYADHLSLLTAFFNHSVGKQLQWGHWSVRDLDARFKDLVDSRTIKRFTGIEAYESHFIIKRKLLPPLSQVVTAESAGRYFGAPVALRDTDHFSSVKPTSESSPSHELLVDFFYHRFAPLIG